jgi:hypothetical protein
MNITLTQANDLVAKMVRNLSQGKDAIRSFK